MHVLINHMFEPKNKITGITSYLFSLLRELLRRNDHSYTLITTWAHEELPKDILEGCHNIVSVREIQSTPLNIIRQTIVIPFYLAKFDADLEFCPNPLGFIRFGRARRISVVHDLYLEKQPSLYPLRHRIWSRVFQQINCFASSELICVSQSTQADLLAHYRVKANKVHVIHEASTLDLSCYREDDSVGDASPFGLFVANVSPNKGALVLNRAINYLIDENIDIRIAHVGRDELGLLKYGTSEKGIYAVGNVSPERLVSYYKRALFLVCSSTHEGFGLPLLEAQTFGIPVIANDIPVLREVAGEGALYYKTNDAHDLAEKIQMMVDSKDLRAEIGELALANSRKFSWSRAARLTTMLFG